METIWLLAITAALLLSFSFIFYHILKGYVVEEFGKKWLTIWGNKLYFWQSLIFMSMASTVLLMYLLKRFDVLAF